MRELLLIFVSMCAGFFLTRWGSYTRLLVLFALSAFVFVIGQAAEGDAVYGRPWYFIPPENAHYVSVFGICFVIGILISLFIKVTQRH